MSLPPRHNRRVPAVDAHHRPAGVHPLVAHRHSGPRWEGWQPNLHRLAFALRVGVRYLRGQPVDGHGKAATRPCTVKEKRAVEWQWGCDPALRVCIHYLRMCGRDRGGRTRRVSEHAVEGHGVVFHLVGRAAQAASFPDRQEALALSSFGPQSVDRAQRPEGWMGCAAAADGWSGVTSRVASAAPSTNPAASIPATTSIVLGSSWASSLGYNPAQLICRLHPHSVRFAMRTGVGECAAERRHWWRWLFQPGQAPLEGVRVEVDRSRVFPPASAAPGGGGDHGTSPTDSHPRPPCCWRSRSASATHSKPAPFMLRPSRASGSWWWSAAALRRQEQSALDAAASSPAAAPTATAAAQLSRPPPPPARPPGITGPPRRPTAVPPVSTEPRCARTTLH